MKEDPLERLEREEREKKNGGLKTVMYVLAAVALLLAAALAYVWFQKSSLVRDLNIEKEDLTEQIVALQQDYNNLSSDYEAINGSEADIKREWFGDEDRVGVCGATSTPKWLLEKVADAVRAL